MAEEDAENAEFVKEAFKAAQGWAGDGFVSVEMIRSLVKDLTAFEDDKIEEFLMAFNENLGVVDDDEDVERCRAKGMPAKALQVSADIYGKTVRGKVSYVEFVDWIMSAELGGDETTPAQLQNAEKLRKEAEAHAALHAEALAEARKQAEAEARERAEALAQQEEKRKRSKEAALKKRADEDEKMRIQAEEEERRYVQAQAEKEKRDAAEEEELALEMRSVMPDTAEIVRLLKAAAALGDGPSPAEFARMQNCFNRYKTPGSADMDKDDLPMVLKLLGLMFIEADECKKIADAMSSFATIDFDEFEEFVGKFRAAEHQKFKDIFDKFDEDGGGTLSCDELLKVMSSMGFTPLRAMVEEALSVVDEDGGGTLDFTEFVHLLAIYRYTEGFTRKEVIQAFKAFKELSEDDDILGGKTVPVSQIMDFLLTFFGPQSAELAKRLGDEAIAGKPVKEGDVKSDAEPGFSFSEVLLTARRLREEEFRSWRDLFEEKDADGGGVLDMQEVQGLIRHLGYTLTIKEVKDVVQEVEEDVDEDGVLEQELDFDEFVHLMGIFKVRDGFSKRDLRAMEVTFTKFDADGSGEVETVELSDMLRFMGESLAIEDVQRLLGQADPNDSGSLDWREFLRFMRLHREEELTKFKKVFKYHAEGEKLSKGKLKKALLFLGFGELSAATWLLVCPKQEDDSGDPISPSAPMVGFEGFVVAIGVEKQAGVIQVRQAAGFSEERIGEFQKLFNKFDADRSGIIDPKEVGALLGSLNFSMRTAEDRDNVQKSIEKARANALEAGIEDVGKGGSITFMVLLQLLRQLFSAKDQARLDREKDAMTETMFKVGEAKQFMEMFLNWYEKDKAFEESSGNAPVDSSEDDKFSDKVKTLHAAAIRRLMATLGCKTDAKLLTQLEGHVKFLNEAGRVDFPDFLRLLRWMMESNLAGINSIFAS